MTIQAATSDQSQKVE